MRRLLVAALVAIVPLAAFAQTPAAPTQLAPPPPGTLATTQTVRAQDAYGDKYAHQQTTYRTPTGVAQDASTTQTRVPVPPPVTTTTTDTSTTTIPH